MAEMGPLVDVTFDSTGDDFLRYVEHVALTGPFYRSQMQRTRVSLLVVLLLLPVVMGLLFGIGQSPDRLLVGVLSAAVPFWIAGIVTFFVWPVVWRRQLKSISRRQVGMENPLLLLGPKRYIFDEAAVRFSSSYSGGYVMWPAVMRVTSDADALYLHVSQASAHIVPSRAFPSEEAFGLAVQMAVALHAQATGQQA